jgi:DNA repair exonuclease SbcCD ATPase subunit
VRFEELRIRGFLSFGEKEQVVSLGKRGLVLIEGENLDDPTTSGNGSGKSSISDALLWCLFGKTMRGVTGDDVVNRHLEVGCRVITTFSNDKGEVFRVERHRQDTKEKNRLLFTGPTGGLTANETSETEAKLREVLGMDFDTFTSAVVFGQGAPHFASMTDKEMKRITDKLVGVEALAQAGKKAYEDYRDLQDERDVLKAEQKDLAVLKEDKEEAEADAATWEKDHRRTVKEFEKEVASLALVPMKLLEQRAQEASSALDSLSKGYEAALKAKSAADSQYHVAKAEHQRLWELSGKLMNQPGVCDHCGQQVGGSALLDHKERLEGDLEKAREASSTLKKVFEAADKAFVQARSDLEVGKKKSADAMSDVKVAKNSAAEVARAQKRLEELRTETNPHHKAVARTTKALEDAEEHNTVVDASLRELQQELAAQEFVASMFSDKGANGNPPLKALLVESVAPFINKKLAHYSRFLTDGNVAITFETQTQLKSGEYRDSYLLKAVNRTGASAYEGSSGGERRKIDVAVFLALQDLAASRSREQVKLAIYDEPFDALDETAQEVVIELLLDEVQRKDTIFVVTHREELKAFFPQRITVVKEGGSSHVA